MKFIINFLQGLILAIFLLCVFVSILSIVPKSPAWILISIWLVLATFILAGVHYWRSKPVVLPKKVIRIRPSIKEIFAFLNKANPECVLHTLTDLDLRTVKDYSDLDSNQQIMKSEENALRERVRSTASYLLQCRLEKHAKTLLRVQFAAMCIYHSTLLRRMELEGIISPSEPSSATEDGGAEAPTTSEEEETESGAESPSTEYDTYSEAFPRTHKGNNIVTVYLDKHEILYMIEDCARGSRLSQHIWEIVVTKIIRQLTDDEMDFLWFFLRRDMWDMYLGSSLYDVCGDEDFLHCMAALHRGNHRFVKFYCEGDKSKESYIYCYRFNNAWHPINQFNQFIPEEWVISVTDPYDTEHAKCDCLEIGKEAWWNDLEVYNKKPSEIRPKGGVESQSPESATGSEASTSDSQE